MPKILKEKKEELYMELVLMLKSTRRIVKTTKQHFIIRKIKMKASSIDLRARILEKGSLLIRVNNGKPCLMCLLCFLFATRASPQ